MLTLVTDGWKDTSNNESIINYMLVTPDGQSIFHSSHPTGTDRHTAEYIAEKIIEVIEAVGSEKIIAFCTDGAANMLKAAKLINRKYPKICGIRCAAHSLNLTIKDIMELPMWDDSLTMVNKVNSYFRNHTIIAAHLACYQKKIQQNNCTCIACADTMAIHATSSDKLFGNKRSTREDRR